MATSDDHESSSRGRPRVRVMAASDALSGALRMRLAEARTIAPYLSRDGQLACGDIAVVSSLDYPPEACRQLVAIGVQVLVLAPVPREGDRKKFADAGVLAYLPMTVDADELLGWVEGALARTEQRRLRFSDD